MLKRLYIDNYKCFSDFEFTPGQLTLLMGRNGSGKSALFDALSLLRDFTLGKCGAEAFTSRSRTRWQARTEQTFELETDLRDPASVFHGRYHYKYGLVIDHSDAANPRVLRETLDTDGVQVLRFRDQQVSVLSDDGESWKEFPSDGRRSAVANLPLSLAPHTVDLDLGNLYFRPAGFREWIYRLHCLTPDPSAIVGRFEEGTDLGRDLAPDLSNLAPWYRRVHGEQMERQPEFDHDLRSLIDDFVSVSFEPTGRMSYELGVKLRTGGMPGGMYTLALDELSDGQRKLFAFYALLRFGAARPGGGQTLWIDEPDNFVALAEIQPWLILLRERVEAGDGFQALVTSHHPEVINYLAADCGQVLQREGSGPVRVRAFSIDPASGLSPAELIARDRA